MHLGSFGKMSDESSIESGARKRILAAANDFSPGIVELRQLLQVVKGTPKDRNGQAEEIRKSYFSNSAGKRTDATARLKQQLQLSRNVLIGLENYLLYDPESGVLTATGEALLQTTTEAELYSSFAKHILENVDGLEVLRIIGAMQQAGRVVEKASLVTELNRNGFTTTLGGSIPTNTVNHLRLIGWLRKAGVVSEKGYAIDQARVRELVGTSVEDANEASELSDRQKIFLQVMRRDFEVNGARESFVKDIIALCKVANPELYSRTDDIRRAVLIPLIEGGWIEHIAKSKEGRGGASGRVAPLGKLQMVAPEYLGIGSIAGIPSEVRARLNQPLANVFEDLDSSDTFVKGLALETLSVKLLYELGLTPVAFRERGAANDGAEVDLIAEGTDLHFHRWMVQCKNTKVVGVSALAKEVGMAVLYRAQVVLLVTTGQFSGTVFKHARELSQSNSIQAILVDRAALQDYRRTGVMALVSHFNKWAKDILEWKRPQLGGL